MHKLLFDNNISYRLVGLLSDLFQDSTHVMSENLDESKDMLVWEFAKTNGFCIVTKDSDFVDFSIVFGFPPKVILIKTGNCKIRDIEALIRQNRDFILGFLNDSENGLLTISS